MASYQKHIETTEAMLAQIRKLAGSDVSAEDIVVFEATAAGTRPVKQRGSMYNGAKMTRDTLEAMARAVNSGEQSVPLHTMHNNHSELPVGRVFQATVVGSMDGEYELRAFFYLPKTETALIESINLGVLDEVSVGFLAEKAMCSKCGHDFFAPGADFYQLFSRTCDNNHVLGEDGVHLILSGVDTFSELSLVSRGASSRAKIHGQNRQSERLAASGAPVAAMFLSATPTVPNQKEASVADPISPELAARLEAFEAKLTASTDNAAALAAATAQLATVQAALAASEAQVVTIQEALTASEATVGELNVKLAAGVQSALTADLTAGGLAASTITDGLVVPTSVSSAFRPPKRN